LEPTGSENDPLPVELTPEIRQNAAVNSVSTPLVSPAGGKAGHVNHRPAFHKPSNVKFWFSKRNRTRGHRMLYAAFHAENPIARPAFGRVYNSSVSHSPQWFNE